MSYKLGLDCKLYRKSGSTLGLVSNVKDLTVNMTKAEADLTTRANDGWKAVVGTLKEASLDFEMVYNTADADFTAFQDAFLNNTVVNLLLLDGDNGTVGNKGFRADWVITGFTQNQKLTEGVTVSVTAKIAYSATAPASVTSPVTP